MLLFLLPINIKAMSSQVVDKSKQWVIKLNDYFALDTLNKQNILVKDSKGKNVNISLGIGKDKKSLVINCPKGGYKPGERYILTVNNKFHYKNGKKLKQKIIINFSIRNNVKSDIKISDIAVDDTYISNNSIYYLNCMSLFKINMDGTGRQSLNCGGVWINSINDNGYYLGNSEGGGAVKIDKSIKTSNKITNLYTYCFTPYGEYDYYIKSSLTSNDGTLCKAKDDGSIKDVKIIEDNVNYMDIYGNYIFYSSVSDNKIYKIDIDGTNKTELNAKTKSSFAIYNGWLYFLNVDENNSLYKININNSGKNKICSDKADNIKEYDDYLYYTNSSDNNKLYSIKIDGTNRKKLNDNESYDLNLYGKYIYYINGSDSNKIYKLNN